MSVLPVPIIDALWAELGPRLPVHPAVAPDHPPGCHRQRIPDRVVFEHLLVALMSGLGYERRASHGCSDRTIRRRLDEWSAAGIDLQVFMSVLEQYDRMIGLDPGNVAVDGCITKAPCGGEVVGESPVDRGKQRLKRSVLVDGNGIPLHLVLAGANRHDAPLLEETLTGLEPWGPVAGGTTVHLDRGYAGRTTEAVLASRGLNGVIARKGVPAPVQAGKRRVVERTHALMNGCGKLRRCTERRRGPARFSCVLAAVIVIIEALLHATWSQYRWASRPPPPR